MTKVVIAPPRATPTASQGLLAESNCFGASANKSNKHASVKEMFAGLSRNAKEVKASARGRMKAKARNKTTYTCCDTNKNLLWFEAIKTELAADVETQEA